jgi:cyclophilin family peptidyl-prolyl cis-trans isomerase
MLIRAFILSSAFVAGIGMAADKAPAAKEATKAAAKPTEKVAAPAAAVPAPAAAPAAATAATKPTTGGTRVEMVTTAGKMIIELNDEKAPVSVKNFLAYVNKKHYNGTVFHRVIKSFMIQGGGFKATGDSIEELASDKPITNESNNGLTNTKGTIAMARTNDPNSATAQFFINAKDNDFLNGGGARPGYAVFGKVVEGINVLEKIEGMKTGQRKVKVKDMPGQMVPFDDVPLENVVIQSVTVLKTAS